MSKTTTRLLHNNNILIFCTLTMIIIIIIINFIFSVTLFSVWMLLISDFYETWSRQSFVTIYLAQWTQGAFSYWNALNGYKKRHLQENLIFVCFTNVPQPSPKSNFRRSYCIKWRPSGNCKMVLYKLPELVINPTIFSDGLINGQRD